MSPSISERYDVVILGGGVAGLLLASELAAEQKLLLIEQSRSFRSYKYWLTDHASMELNRELETAVEKRYDSLDFISYDQHAYRCRGSYILWNTSYRMSNTA